MPLILHFQTPEIKPWGNPYSYRGKPIFAREKNLREPVLREELFLYLSYFTNNIDINANVGGAGKTGKSLSGSSGIP
jgi:hypothetical protein